MHKSIVAQFVLASIGLAAIAAAPASLAIAHEGHKMECNATGMSAMHGDMQAMPDGEAKTEAMREMQMAHDMMAKKDMKGCMEHMDKAMEAMEK